jgi:peptidoglycan/LPS O-acetylase OafA/YrhL
MKMKVKNSDKFRVLMGLAVSMMVIAGVAAYFMFSGTSGYNPGELIAVISAVVLALAAAYFIWDKKRDVDAGMPFEDELSKKIMHRAGYYSYFASMYTALGVSMFKELIEKAIGIPELTVSSATGIIILVPALVFFITIFYLKRKGDA